LSRGGIGRLPKIASFNKTQKLAIISESNIYEKFSFTKCGSRRYFSGSLAVSSF